MESTNKDTPLEVSLAPVEQAEGVVVVSLVRASALTRVPMDKCEYIKRTLKIKTSVFVVTDSGWSTNLHHKYPSH